MASESASQESTLTLRRFFKAPREMVFRAWTDPEELKNWWSIGEGWKITAVEVDLRVGGQFRIEMRSSEEGGVHIVKGTFQEVVRPQRLVYTWIVEDPGLKAEETFVTVEFSDQGGSTEVVLTHERLTEKKLRDAVGQGWTLVLDGLQKLLVYSGRPS